MLSLSRTKRWSKLMTRNICFDRKVANRWFGKTEEANSLLNGSLHAGCILQSQQDSILILCRTTNNVCIVKDLHSGKIFSVRAANLTAHKNSVSAIDKDQAMRTLTTLFDSKRVLDISIRMPFKSNAPLTFDPFKGCIQYDYCTPYTIIRYKDKSPCVTFPCSIISWYHCKSPIQLAVLDENFVDLKSSLWTENMNNATTIDLSRMASFPEKDLHTHFQVPVFTTAKQPELVIAAMMQVILAQAVLTGPMYTDGGELDEEEPEEVGLVIGHYEVGDDNKPLPGAL